MRALACGLSGLALLLAAAGCRPELTQSQVGVQEEEWISYVRQSYPGFQPPRTPPTGVRNNVSEQLIEQEESAVVVPGPAAGEEDLSAGEELVSETPVPAAGAVAEPPPAGEDLAVEPAAEPAAETAVTTGQPEQEPAAEPVTSEDKTVYYVVKPGDTLGGIARKFYKDASKYDLIYRANTDVIKNPNRLQLGVKLVIPQM